MRKIIHTIILLSSMTAVFAGNPDRQGQAGVSQVLINPWARSAGLHAMTVATATGVEAIHINPAGGARIASTEIALSHTRYFSGSDININAFGFSKAVGKGGAITVGVMSINVGKLEESKEELGGVTGATFTPNIFNLGVGYSYKFENKISVGTMFHGISESIAQVSTFGFSVDAGVQYVTGKNDNFKFGIALRNIGGAMKFDGQGLTFPTPNREGQYTYNITAQQRSQKFELPSTLNIGASYDIVFNQSARLAVVGQFTSNSFSRDNVGGGLELKFMNLFTLRGGYRHEVGVTATTVDKPVTTGPCGGFSVQVPFKKGNKDTGLGIDYGYQATNPFKGNHSLALRINL
ncbi:MAG: PorV/PorQ family protein [Saprospiraceae bacterium]